MAVGSAGILQMAKDAKQASVPATVPAGRKRLLVRLVVTPGQSLGVTAHGPTGLIYSPTAFTGCTGSPQQMICTYKIPVPASGRYSIVFGRLKGPKLAIRYTITTS